MAVSRAHKCRYRQVTCTLLSCKCLVKPSLRRYAPFLSLLERLALHLAMQVPIRSMSVVSHLSTCNHPLETYNKVHILLSPRLPSTLSTSALPILNPRLSKFSDCTVLHHICTDSSPCHRCRSQVRLAGVIKSLRLRSRLLATRSWLRPVQMPAGPVQRMG